MFLDLERIGARQPLARQVGPAKSYSHQGQKFLKPLFLGDMRFLQTEASRLQATEQGFYFPSLAVIRKYRLSFRTACHNHIFAFWGSQPHQRNVCSQDSSPTHQQSTNAGFFCAKQVLRGHLLVATSIRDLQVLCDPKAKGNLLSPEVRKPVGANKFTVGGHKIKGICAKKSHILFYQCDSFLSVGTTFR